ncbi:histidine phosphatase superfamily [Elsinoe ampelina]|uniref:Histidine phosphatase superfamily n=1 Tax=Elsinoe ampelina TaxID=302913 RepID=A0A6A6G9S2_9PEZI|nr:histidine phosphatase superfamily [Elsinoe ampelina]
MPPTIILIRHGEAEHNATRNWSLPDPPLTATGEEQCRLLHTHLSALPLASRVRAIITSPFVRTVQTTLIGLDFLIRAGVNVETDALWQENSDKPCDTGSPVRALAEKFPGVDFSGLEAGYPFKGTETVYAFTREKVVERGQMVLRDLYKREEGVVAVVSHSGFLRAAVSRRHYANADYRIFTFEEWDGEGEVRLRESKMTEGKGGMGWSEEGVASIRDSEFPRPTVEKQEGTKQGNEATEEVPKS